MFFVLSFYLTKQSNKVDLPEIKGNHRKFRTLVSSYIGKRNHFKQQQP